MADKPRPTFPAASLPEDPADQKLLGVYPQRQEGRLLQRIRIPGGRLSIHQWLAMAHAAEQVGARPALHLTTRQCIEVNDLTAETIPALQSLLAEAGLSTVGAAGDTLRTVTVDPASGMAPGSPDLLPLANAIGVAIEAVPGVWGLPRKFKISLSADESARMRPWITDVGFVAAADGSLTAVVAGSLGAKPGTGVPFGERLTPEDAVALSVAAVRLHAMEGDRENRRRARLRHVRERMGDAEFLDRLRDLFAEERAAARAAAPVLVPADLPNVPHVRLGVPHGDLPLGALRELVTLMPAEGEMRIGIEHDLHLFGIEPDGLPPRIAAWAHAGRVVACPGASLCTKAAAPTHEAADALAGVAAEYPDRLFAISGCPNSCAHAAVADIGLIGRTRRIGDERAVRYSVYVGGDGGAGPGLSSLVAEDVALEELEAVVERALSR